MQGAAGRPGPCDVAKREFAATFDRILVERSLTRREGEVMDILHRERPRRSALRCLVETFSFVPERTPRAAVRYEAHQMAQLVR